jgi:dethiobiotin synthetase
MKLNRKTNGRPNRRTTPDGDRQCPGLFVVGVDTGVGKTYVACRIAAALTAAGLAVGVYKPAASGCRRRGARLISTDASLLWKAAGEPGHFARVCPQKFAAPLAPHLAAREEEKQLDPVLLREGLSYWTARSDLVIVEGAGGLMSPLGEREYVADLARDFGFPLIVVTANRIGAINQTLQTLIAASTLASNVPVAGIVLNDISPPKLADPSTAGNRCELELRCVPPVLAQLAHRAKEFDRPIDWQKLAVAKPIRVRESKPS